MWSCQMQTWDESEKHGEAEDDIFRPEKFDRILLWQFWVWRFNSCCLRCEDGPPLWCMKWGEGQDASNSFLRCAIKSYFSLQLAFTLTKVGWRRQARLAAFTKRWQDPNECSDDETGALIDQQKSENSSMGRNIRLCGSSSYFILIVIYYNIHKVLWVLRVLWDIADDIYTYFH